MAGVKEQKGQPVASLVYASFDLLIERAGTAYRVPRAHSPAGQASAEFNLPFPISPA